MRLGTLLAVLGALAVAASPAAAAKKKAKTPSGKIVTATAATSSAAAGALIGAAVCPKGTKVVGGGFLLQPHTNTTDFLYPIESRRSGGNTWIVSAFRVDGGVPGPSMTLNAEAYCRANPGKLSVHSAAQTVEGAASTASPVATCPVGRTPVGGGFVTSPAVAPTTLNSILYDNVMAGSVGWVMRSVNLANTPSTTSFAAEAYCQRSGAKPPKTMKGSGSVASTGFTPASATTQNCPGKLQPFAGGFTTAPFIGAPTGLVEWTESRRAGKAWRVTATRLNNGTSPTAITALAYCS